MTDLFTVSEQLAAKAHSLGYNSLSPAERVFHAVWSLESEVNHGGFEQFFHSAIGDYATETITALREIGALQCAKIVERACALFPESTPNPNGNVRRGQLKEITDGNEGVFADLNAAFYEYPDDIPELLAAYWLKHGAEVEAVAAYASPPPDKAGPNPYASPQTAPILREYTSDSVEQGRTVVLCIALFMVGISVVTILLFNLQVGPQRLLAQVVRLGLTIGLGYYLYQGKTWARYLVVFLLGFAVVSSLPDIPIVITNANPLIAGYFLVMIGGYAVSVVALLAMPSVRAFFAHLRSRT